MKTCPAAAARAASAPIRRATPLSFRRGGRGRYSVSSGGGGRHRRTLASSSSIPSSEQAYVSALVRFPGDVRVHAQGSEFRTTPAGVHDIHANLSIANMDFEEFAAAAHEAPDQVYSSF
ncbi:DUF6924 domain-containing protein [Streptomyces sp. NPDC060048]|uniref:DUF6924 domain-containing protein n=1 Tax=unclassified Streptomyces TaxID=2593676 RepID=UPI00368C44ED